ncbi:MAG: hydroxypyruvate isomerase family protein [Rhodospirillaceae bacterium]
MPRFSAHMNFLFQELPFEERFAAAAKAGFQGVEMMCPQQLAPVKLADIIAMAEIAPVLMNAPAGDWEAGERGIAALSRRQKEFRESIHLALDYCELMDCPRIHVLAGLVPDEEDWPEALEIYRRNLEYAADECAEAEVTVVIEAINDRDMPGYFLHRPDDAVQVIRDLEKKNLKLLYDLYHAQIMQGGLTDFIEENLDIIAHIQVAGVPGRNEPDGFSEVNWGYLFNLLDAHGYDGWVGCEYQPRIDTLSSFKWAKEWGLKS